MYIKKPMEIENRSMEIIRKAIVDPGFSPKELQIAMRMVHTTGDFDYSGIIDFRNDFIEKALSSIREGGIIFTDTKMALSGINKKALDKAGCEVRTFIDNEKVLDMSREKGTTRSACAVDLALEKGIRMFVVGNAPTALFRILEHVEEGSLDPSFVVGVPVGFVGAAESKEKLREFGIPSISTVGTKGGSNVAASIINALLYMMVER
ncbi:MAG TPA: precorrin-8X methylmutase [Tissierellaceae bacterium]|jgi:precorrin-8X/cobalt-precorrin-8 methylmutase|nr:precorrin-8X methylmutase [Tissierellaceae bacterium]